MQTTTTHPTIFGAPGRAGRPARPGRRAVGYGRMSDDDGTGQVKIDDQLSQSRNECVTRDLDLIAEFSDNGISAYMDTNPLDLSIRPGFLQLVRLIRSGQVDYVVCYQMSRVVRDREQRAELIALCGRMKVNIVAARGQDFNLASATGRGFAGMLGEQDSMESEIKSERGIDAALRRAKDGRPNGRLGYGWTTTGTGRHATFEVDEGEAAVVREISGRIARGDSVRSIRTDLNARGVPAPINATWIPSSIRMLALRPSNAALRVHHPGQPDEEMYPGCWPELVSRSEWERVNALLRDPARTFNPGGNRGPRAGARKHMLSCGVGRCGVCGEPLRAANKRGGRKPNGHVSVSRVYVCQSPRGCTGRSREHVDAYVNMVIGKRLSQPGAIAWAMPNEDASRVAAARVDELTAKLAKATDRWLDNRVNDATYDRMVQTLQPQIDQAVDECRQHVSDLDLDEVKAVAGPEAMTQWAALPLERKVRLLKGFGIEVILDRRTRSGPGFEPETVRVLARGQAVATPVG